MAYKEFEVSRDEVLKRFAEVDDTSEIYAYGCYKKSGYSYIVQLAVILLMLMFMAAVFSGFVGSMIGVDDYAAAVSAFFAVLYIIGIIFVVKTYSKKLKKEYSKKYVVFTNTLIGIACDGCKPDYYTLPYISQMRFKRGTATDLVRIEYLHTDMTDVDSKIVIHGFHNADELCERYTGGCKARIYLDGRRVR